jgi:predicted transcriptional regulator of viral defense system
MTKYQKLKPILHKPVFYADEAKKLGVHPSLLNYYVNKGLIVSIARGVYQAKTAEVNTDFQYEDLIITAKSVKNGVICLISALDIYALTEEIPSKFWIAVPHNTSSPKRDKAIFKRMRDIETGTINYQLGGETIVIFDIERTIIDSFRFLSLETAMKALKTAINKNKVDMKKLLEYAKKLRVNITPYIYALTI